MSNPEESKNGIPPMSDAERKKKWRDKKTASMAADYLVPLIDQAKAHLLAMPSPDLKLLLENEMFREGLNESEIAQLKTYFYHLRGKLKKDQASSALKDREKLDIEEKAKRFANDEISDLRNSLILPQSYAERAQVIEDKINENLFNFLEYMEALQTTPQDLLKIIVALMPKLEEETFTQLFVRVCALYKGEPLPVSADMIKQAIVFLVDNKKDNRATIGLLRLVYQNSISFSYLPTDLLLGFQNVYEQVILQFFKNFATIKSQVIESLPGTAFCFTGPLLKALKEDGRVLHEQLPYQFMPYIIEIICYTFDDVQESFSRFLTTFKDGCRKLYYLMLESDFSKLLQALLDETKSMNSIFFKSLEKATQVLIRAFKLLQERRVGKFDSLTIQNIVEGNEEQYLIMTSLPKILKTDNFNAIDKVFSRLVVLNNFLGEYHNEMETQLSGQDQKPFTALGISTLMPLQIISFKLWGEAIQSGRWFIQYETGQGKTALCFAIASKLTYLKQLVFIINRSDDLTFRDFKIATNVSEKAGVKVLLLKDSALINVTGPCIVYSTISNFVKYQDSFQLYQVEKQCLILDEFDAILFDKNDNVINELASLRKFDYVVAFSGSDLQPTHINFIEQGMLGRFVNMNQRSMEASSQQSQGTQICHGLNEYKKCIIEVCSEQSERTPVVVIAGQHCDRIFASLQTAKLPSYNLMAMNSSKVDSSVAIFTKRQFGKYPIFLLSEEQGRGIDFKTDSIIEQNGGILVIIAVLPKNFLSFRQFIGRTGRVGNKGVYRMIVFDSAAKNLEGDAFMIQQLENLKNDDLLHITQITSSILKRFGQNISARQQVEEVKNEFVSHNIQESTNINNLDRETISSFEVNPFSSVNNVPIVPHPSKLPQQEDQADKPISSTPLIQSGQKKRAVKEVEKQIQKDLRTRSSKKTPAQLIDESYFEGYSDYAIHQEMIADTVRVEAYRRAITTVAENKIVIDVGAGTGILSIMAVKAGATKVYAIENSLISKNASVQFEENKVNDKVELFVGLAEDFELEGVKADIIVSEWMGYMLLCENMLPSVISVRDRCMAAGGIMIPRRSRLWFGVFQADPLLPLQILPAKTNDEQMYGSTEVCPPDNMLSGGIPILDLDLSTMENMYNNFRQNFSIQITKAGIASGLVSWFDAELIEGVVLDTSPQSPKTHWEQTMFRFQKPFEVRHDAIVDVRIDVKQQFENHRGLDITFEIQTNPWVQGFKHRYKMN